MARIPMEPSRGSSGSDVTSSLKIPPHDLDVEKSLLAAMIVDRDVIADVIPIINRSHSDWFYLPLHQLLFEALIDLYTDSNQSFDIHLIREHFRLKGHDREAANIEWLVDLVDHYADSVNAAYYATTIRDKGVLRSLIRVASEISSMAYASRESGQIILDEAERRILEVTEKRITKWATPLSETIQVVSEHLRKRRGGELSGIGTGITKLDEFTDGFQPGDLIIVAARPSMGKTALGLTIAHHMSYVDQNPVLFFSMEMSASQIGFRLLCAEARYNSHRLRRGAFSEEDAFRLLNVCSDLQSSPMYIDDTSSMSPLELRAKVRNLSKKHNIKAVFVDYLQLMHIPGSENRQVEVATISRQLKGLARELNIPVIVMAQLNRASETRDANRPRMADLRESGAIEQDADVVLLIHREEYYRTKDETVKGKAELILEKQRNGPTGIIELAFLKDQSWFANPYTGGDPGYVPGDFEG